MSTTQQQNKEIIARFNKEFIEGGNEALFWETVSPEFINRSAAPGQDGPDGAFQWFTQVLKMAFPDLTVTIHDQIAEGDKTVTRKSYEATHMAPFLGVPATGRRVSFGVIDIIRIVDGKYVEHWASPEMFDLYRQITA
ncbi:ester cyclase [Mycobacterium avium]|uniref:Ester cyclase n=1 Tax=Mycobacterium avium (strain 104) TaxID=243243 RepID=A0A0H2ZV29_MYCA1|nr:ester cyclase [Mycobacterium avium]ABK66351.1 conserved hypothetical protein [Mycobacterium avium 104]KDP08964.1 hypothetical protein MAV101_02515 [Mycobacterium avium subsp. hominissuis 101]MCG3242804.1 ester cyclase [Mycobacterium avium subsp. hominissuis]